MYGDSESVIHRHTMMGTLKQTAELSFGRPSVIIKISPEDSHPDKIFTNGSIISGEIIVKSSVQLPFTQININFEGNVRTWMEKFGAVQPGTGHYATSQTVSGVTPSSIPFLTADQFLRLSQPIDPRALPSPRVLQPDTPLILPFTFTIPSRLLPQTCTHSDMPAHLLLPPSLNSQVSRLDDSAPDMTHIQYSLTATLRSNTRSTVATAYKPITIVPHMFEAPPLHISPASGYTLTSTRSVRRILKKLGNLTLTSSQPPPLRLPAAQTTLPLTLTFSGERATAPPALTAASIALKTHTFYSTARMTTHPNRISVRNDLGIGCYTTTHHLSTRCLGNVAWKQDGCNWTVQMRLPIAAPEGVFLLPSFETCFVARAYDLVVVVKAEGVRGGVKVRVPVQVCSASEKEAVEIRAEEDGPPGYALFVDSRGVASRLASACM